MTTDVTTPTRPVFRPRVPAHVLVTAAALRDHADDYRSQAAILARTPASALAHPETTQQRIADKLELAAYFERIAIGAWR